jgi:dihydroorotase
MEKALLLRGVTVIDPASPAHGATLDIRCEGGVIAEMAPGLSAEGCEVWESPGSCVSPGWVDGQAHFRDPGEEQKEGLESGLAAAAAGGFTDVVLLPDTQPALAHRGDLAYLQSRAQGHVTRIHAMGLLSQEGAGDRLADGFELAEAGAVGFFDATATLRPEMLRRGLEYTGTLGKPVITLPLETDLNRGAQMHEGPTSTLMGVMGTPDIAEVMRIQRDLEILRYAGGRLHFSVLSTRRGVQLLRQAKSEGLAVTAGTSAYHLWFCDRDLMGFDGVLKVWPPFRSEDDRQALREAIADGTLDVLVSDHKPQDTENHDVPFVQAPMGMGGTEAVFAVAQAALEPLPLPGGATQRLEVLVRALTRGPREVYGLPPASVAVGAPVCLTWFDPQGLWQGFRHSRAVNVPASQHGTDHWKGRALGIVTTKGCHRAV